MAGVCVCFALHNAGGSLRIILGVMRERGMTVPRQRLQDFSFDNARCGVTQFQDLIIVYCVKKLFNIF